MNGQKQEPKPEGEGPVFDQTIADWKRMSWGHYNAPVARMLNELTRLRSVVEEVSWVAERFVDTDLAHDDPERAVRIMGEMLDYRATDSLAGASVPASDFSRSTPDDALTSPAVSPEAAPPHCSRCGAGEGTCPQSSLDEGKTWRCYYREECARRAAGTSIAEPTCECGHPHFTYPGLIGSCRVRCGCARYRPQKQPSTLRATVRDLTDAERASLTFADVADRNSRAADALVAEAAPRVICPTGGCGRTEPGMCGECGQVGAPEAAPPRATTAPMTEERLAEIRRYVAIDEECVGPSIRGELLAEVDRLRAPLAAHPATTPEPCECGHAESDSTVPALPNGCDCAGVGKCKPDAEAEITRLRAYVETLTYLVEEWKRAAGLRASLAPSRESGALLDKLQRRAGERALAEAAHVHPEALANNERREAEARKALDRHLSTLERDAARWAFLRDHNVEVEWSGPATWRVKYRDDASGVSASTVDDAIDYARAALTPSGEPTTTPETET